MADFTHLHVHTEYSPLDAPIALENLVKKAKSLGYKSLAITDHGTISGWVKYALACKKHDLKPIFGMEAYFTENRLERKRQNHHLVLLAKDNEGVRNIGRLTEQANTDGYYYSPRMDWELLEKHHKGVIATSACVSGIVPETYVQEGYEPAMRHAGRFKEIFGDDFYLEVQYHNLDVERKAYEGVAKIAAANGIKIVGTNDVHYLNKNDASIQEAVMALNTKKCMKDPSRIQHGTNQFYLKSPEEMVSFLGGQNRQAVMSTMEIAEKCQGGLTFGKPELPLVLLPNGFTDQMTYLEHLAREGMKRIGKNGDPIYEARYKEEMEVILKLRDKGYDFDRYFLIVAEYCNWARKNGIWVGAGRGSACGSLVIYCIGITDIDPLPLDLLFERFLDETRNEMPDIDVDFDSRRTDEVYKHVCEVYGNDHCAKIGTFNTYHPASAIKAAFRVFDPGGDFEREEHLKKLSSHLRESGKYQASKKNPQDKSSKSMTNSMANNITSLIPKGQQGSKLVLSRAKSDEDHKCIYDVVPEINDQRKLYPEIFQFAEHIEGLVEKKGIHAAGRLITAEAAVDLAPKQYVRDPESSEEESFATVYDMQDVEKLGGIKFDFLSTKVLGTFCLAVEEIKKRGEWKYPWDLNNLPLNDPEVLKLFARGDTLAIFQFESDGMQRVLRNLSPNCFEDIVAANALYRPGPMDNIDEFVARKKGGKVTYPVPALEPVLRPTYGIFVYQEQIIKAVRVLAGFSGSEGDKVRKAMGKKKQEILDQIRPKFVSGCEKLGTCSQGQAKTLWETMERFASYAFNKSHSAAYSKVAYQCAFLKTYHPAEFMAAQMSIEGEYEAFDTVAIYERGAKNMGIQIKPLDINRSKAYYTIESDGKTKYVRRGFFGVKGVGGTSAANIVAGQPYKDFFDYSMRAKRGVQSNVVASLVDNGAFDCFRAALAKRTGKGAITNGDLKAEFEDKSKRAEKEKRQTGARKEEREGIGSIFDTTEDGIAGEFAL